MHRQSGSRALRSSIPKTLNLGNGSCWAKLVWSARHWRCCRTSASGAGWAGRYGVCMKSPLKDGKMINSTTRLAPVANSIMRKNKKGSVDGWDSSEKLSLKRCPCYICSIVHCYSIQWTSNQKLRWCFPSTCRATLDRISSKISCNTNLHLHLRTSHKQYVNNG